VREPGRRAALPQTLLSILNHCLLPPLVSSLRLTARVPTTSWGTVKMTQENALPHTSLVYNTHPPINYLSRLCVRNEIIPVPYIIPML